MRWCRIGAEHMLGFRTATASPSFVIWTTVPLTSPKLWSNAFAAASENRDSRLARTIEEDRIDILIHPQSIIHSMVSYVDGSVLAQLGSRDMRTPISYALAWPQRMAAPSPRLDLGEIATLTFEAPDSERFPALRLARAALKTGGSAPTILNASNEEAVAGFLAEKVGFLDIPRIVEETMENIPGSDIRSVDDVLSVDVEARRVARDLMSRAGLQV